MSRLAKQNRCVSSWTHTRVLSSLVVLSACLLFTGCSGRQQASDTKKTAQAASDSQGDEKKATAAQDKKPETDTPKTRDQALAEIDRLAQSGQTKAANENLRKLLLQNPEDYEVVVRIAQLAAAQGKLDEAIEMLSDVPANHPTAGLPALGMSADWCLERSRYKDAITRYEKILELDVRFNLARRKLAFILNRMGRRHEAVKRIRELCIVGDVMQDELHSLIAESDAMYDEPNKAVAAGARSYYPIGDSGKARHLFTENQFSQAADLLESSVLAGNTSPSVVAFYGRALVEAQQLEKLPAWSTLLNEDVKSFPDYWAAVGTLLIQEAKIAEAITALSHAMRLNPTDAQSGRRLVQALQTMDRNDEADAWEKRLEVLKQTVDLNNQIANMPPGTNLSDIPFEELAKNLEAMGRRVEAVFWRSLALKATGDQSKLQQLSQQLKSIVRDKNAFPTQQELLCGMAAPSKLPQLPSGFIEKSGASKQVARVLDKAPVASFEEITDQVGLKQTYKIAVQPTSKRFAIYQVVGGGVAVVDFDLDGLTDLYFAQGSADPPEFVATESDQLFRHLSDGSSHRLEAVTDTSGIREQAYTVGVTSGDWNQDGWPDLAVSNIGTHQLLINQGDGTYRQQALDRQPDPLRVGASLAFGDVTGDQLPDLFVLHYLKDPDMAKLPEANETGHALTVASPFKALAARDILYANQGDGSWTSQIVGDTEKAACTGLGLVLGDLDPKHSGNEVYVANDVRKNQYWRAGQDGKLEDVGAALGCAYSWRGRYTGAMGIAADDFSGNGSTSLFVTNFMSEPANLYVKRNGVYQDFARAFQLAASTSDPIGFGTQAIDYSNDGLPDLVVTNGHVEDMEYKGQPFRQPMQLFANLGNRFELIDVPDSDFWNRNAVGRGLAKLDFDNDGLMDFVVTDLLGQASLVQNRTASKHNWIKLKLIGTESERDAIGTKVKVMSGQHIQHSTVLSGDGYLASNEKGLHIGLGAQSNIDKIVIDWSSGRQQTLQNVTPNQTIQVVEGNQPWLLNQPLQDPEGLR